MPWRRIRLGLLALSVFAGLALPPREEAPAAAPWWEILVGFGLGAMSLVLFLRLLSKRAKEKWRQPSWVENPFRVTQPLQFWHFVGSLFAVLGAAQLAQSIVLGYMITSLTAQPLALGLAALIAVKLYASIFGAELETADSG